MSVKTKDELLKTFDNIIGENTTDESISFLEDITDTLDTLSKKDETDWKAKYEESEASWKKKYHDRFFAEAVSSEETSNELEEDSKPKVRYEDLFKTI